MARQHLYSRVPARMSLFNKTDGYDTFAYSESLSPKFIESELAMVYENQPTKDDAVLIQSGKLPPIFCQRVGEEGDLIQSCVSFLQKDYTGERSAYLVHSLILNEEESRQAFFSPDKVAFNPSLFRTDLADVDMTSFDAVPDPYCEEKAYAPQPAEDTAFLLQNYDHGMLRRLIYALIQVSCGKGKGIFLSLPVPLADFSAASLRFLNGIMQIVPYHIRPLLSFVTYVGDSSKFAGFKIRCLPDTVTAPPSTKGFSLRFRAREAIGFTDEAVATNAFLVNFFFGLLENDAVRREFLRFADHAVETSEALQKPTLKTLTDLVFLFQQCSGLFAENTVLPTDDKVYEFVCTYEKNRTALTDEYRAAALKCLWRYPKKNTAIPKNIFSKVSSLYATETAASRRTVMNIVLELIHTDIMRDKLFTFIKAHYAREEDAVRQTINEDLCRVYYGGFLQPQLLAFFSQNFPDEPEVTRDRVVEKLLLTVRTEAVQAEILEFFDRYYDRLTPTQKKRFYDTFFAMLPECDALADRLTDIVDAHIPSEDEAFRADVTDRLCALVEANQKRREPKLIPMLAAKDGFCAQAVIRRVFGEWSGRKVLTDYVAALAKRPLDGCMRGVAAIWEAAPDMSEDAAGRLTEAVREVFENGTSRPGLFALVSAYEEIDTRLVAGGNAGARACGEQMLNEMLTPAICAAIPEAFNRKQNQDGLETFCAFAADKPAIRESKEYAVIDRYFGLLDAAGQDQAERVLSLGGDFPNKTVRGWIADDLRARLLTGDALADARHDEMRLLVAILVDYLKTGAIRVADAYRKQSDTLCRRLSDAAPNGNAEQLTAYGEQQAMRSLLAVGNLLSGSNLPEDVRAAAFAPDGELAGTVTAFVQTQGKKGRKFVEDALQGISGLHAEYKAYIEQTLAACHVKSGGLFGKLFGK